MATPDPKIPCPVEEILAAVKRFPNGSAGGVDGLRPQHLKDMLSGAPNGATVALAEALAELITLMHLGRIPDAVCGVPYGATLTALKKEDGGLRPIAVGDTLRRLAGKIVVKRGGRVMEEQVRPEQVGCGTRGGAEAAVHAVRCFLEEGRDESQVLLKLDFKNAFNTIHRDVLLHKNSVSWLHALPSSSLGNLLDNNALRISIGLRLGAKLCRPHVCRCGASVDEFCQHGLSCKFSGGRHSRHSALNESLKRALTTARIPAVLEPSGIFRKDKRRLDGMTQVPWKNGKELVWDVTVVDTQALANFAMSTAKAGSAADAAKKRKITKYEDIGSEFEFCPVGLETLGPWGPSATALFEAVGRKMAEVTGEPRSFQFFKQRVSIDIQRDVKKGKSV
ncbi:hypothetical protein RvY_02037 [Ramazzottius varieornatus]|uniref:Reverse transcriptase domain-containing protein n=1 Tax=Ramazzottius varieornatus TaxID=947166 RepID=A0A1D1ULR1_RAMVA|nr:hypothetical protein RvY_02037 [Ramazzottius varieornatus]